MEPKLKKVPEKLEKQNLLPGLNKKKIVCIILPCGKYIPNNIYWEFFRDYLTFWLFGILYFFCILDGSHLRRSFCETL